MSDFESDSLLIYGTDIPRQIDDIGKDLKRIIHNIRIALVKESQIVLTELVTHIIAGYMLSGAEKLRKTKRKSKSVNDEDDHEQLLDQINRFLAHSFHSQMELGQCHPCPDYRFPEDSIFYLSYVLPDRFNLSKLQSIDTSQYNVICALMGVQSQPDGPKLFCLTNYLRFA